MTNDITSTTLAPTLTLEECDASFTKGVLLIRDAVLNYARHGLTPKQIGERVRSLGATESDRTIRRWVGGFRAEKLLPEKEVHRTTKVRREARANGQIGQMHNPQPTPLTTYEEPEDITSAAQPMNVDAIDRKAVEYVLSDYGRWDNQMGFFPDPPLTLIQKHLNDLNLDELKSLQAEISQRINRAECIDV